MFNDELNGLNEDLLQLWTSFNAGGGREEGSDDAVVEVEPGDV